MSRELSTSSSPAPVTLSDLDAVVSAVVSATPIIDLHTHLFPATFGSLAAWGIDELLTYHYLEAELFRTGALTPERYFALDKRARADAIWRALFVERLPLSEASRGVVAVLSALGLPTDGASLDGHREHLAASTAAGHITRVMSLAGVTDVVMTNDPLDPAETPFWQPGVSLPSGFHAALRIDRVLNGWPEHAQAVAAAGYDVTVEPTSRTLSQLRAWLSAWIDRMQPRYVAVSLPDAFAYPADDLRTELFRGAVLPACREYDLPMALMIGVRRGVNPAIRLAGDGVGRADLRAVERLCSEWPDNQFLVTLLSRENQHELCVYARKFANLMPFGCWWFLNNPSMVEEMTRERLEMLGSTFIPQHSDARVVDQLIYKWRNTRRTLVPLLTSTFRLLIEDGRPVTRVQIEVEAARLLRTNAQAVLGLS